MDTAALTPESPRPPQPPTGPCGPSEGGEAAAADRQAPPCAPAAAREHGRQLNLALEMARMRLWRWEAQADTVHWVRGDCPMAEAPPAEERVSLAEFFSRVHADDRPGVARHVAEAFDTGVDYELECRVGGGSPEWRWVSARGVVLKDVHGQPTGVLGLELDITDRKQLEAQFRQAQKMEAVGQLAGGVAHDFNNLLTVIQGHTCLVRSRDDLPADVAESLQQIAEAAEKATHLTRQLLAFSRKRPIDLRSLDLNEVVARLTKMLSRLIGEDVVLDFQYSPQLPRVEADAAMLEQMLLNLAVNARDAMPDGGRLTLSTERYEPEALPGCPHPAARRGRFVRLSVRDTGTGMPPEVLARLFEPFFTTKELGQGTGLGLATVQRLIEQHGGWVEVESALGVGTTFHLFFRPASQALPAEASPAASVVRGGSETILLVEDEGPLRDLARQVLERYGYEVWEASSGPAAWEIWREHSDGIHLLLSDVVLPGGINGRELAEQFRREKPGLRVVLTSGYGLEARLRALPPLPHLRLLPKPYLPSLLAQTIRDCLDERW